MSEGDEQSASDQVLTEVNALLDAWSYVAVVLLATGMPRKGLDGLLDGAEGLATVWPIPGRTRAWTGRDVQQGKLREAAFLPEFVDEARRFRMDPPGIEDA